MLSAIPLKEKDRIVTFLGEESGKKRAVARYARNLRSSAGGAYEPMSEVEVLYFEKEGRELARIDSVERRRSSFPLAADLSAALLLSAMAEQLQTFVPDSDPPERFFRLAAHAMDALFEKASPQVVAVYFDAWILKLTGVFPAVDACAQCGAAIAGERPRFDEALPGFLCAKCGHPGSVQLSREFEQGVRQIFGKKIAEAVLRPRLLSEIASVTGKLRRHFLGYELKSQKVLAQVW